MNLTDVANLRLSSQQIAGTRFKTAKEIVGWMGAIQAQDFAMAKWVLGVRLGNSTDAAIQAAIDHGDILRTHLLRPTWHLVSADDIYWMLELTTPQIQAAMKSRHEELGLTTAVVAKSNRILENNLRGGNHLTREELKLEFAKAKIATDENRMSHLLARAELDGVVCSGALKDGKQTYALLSERVPKTKRLTKDQALAKLARVYFASRCPATLHDFVWWSGLSVTDTRQALEMVKPDFVAETIGAQTFWLTNISPAPGDATVHLLPPFDEFIISYQARSAILTSDNHKKAVSDNGVFRPMIVIDGQVAGIWKRTIKKYVVIVETNFFKRPSRATKQSVEQAAAEYGRFLGKRTETRHD